MRHLGLVSVLVSLAVCLIWAAGFFAEDVARVALGLLVVGGVVVARREVNIELPSWSTMAFRLANVLLVVVVFAHGWARVLAGRMGVDFAIFTQCVHSIATSGVPTTSLLGVEPVNFFTHHFAPVLFVPGALAFVGVAPPLALLLVQSLAFALTLLGVHSASRRLGLSDAMAAGCTLVVGLCPNVRPELLWGVHDEVLSLPFVVWAFVALLAKRPVLSMVLVVLSACGKESYFALAPIWWLIVWRFERPSRAVHLVCAALVASSVAGGALYVFGQPWWSGKAFDHYGKLVQDVGTLWATAGARLGFVVSFFGWLLFLPLVSPRARWLTLAAAPFLGLGLVAEDSEMYRFTGYHSIVPQVIIALAGAVGLIDLKWQVPRRIPAVVLAVLISLQLSWFARSVWKPAGEARAQRWYPAAELESLPKDGVVAVDPAAAIVLLGWKTVRVFTAEERNVPVSRVIARPDGWEVPQGALLTTTEPCEPRGSWIARCSPRQ